MSNRRRIVLTGVSRGLGLALLEEFIRLGHTVYGCARNRKAIHQLAARFPRPHRFHVADTSDREQIEAWSQAVRAEGGPPDLLVNNAAVINQNALLWEVSCDEFSHVVDVNIKGVFHVLRYFVPAMIERGAGVIVNFSSGWGRATSPQVAPYCATKWAIEGLTRALADELPYGLAAIPLNPGIIHTDMLETCFGNQAAEYITPASWAKRAAPFLLELGPEDNGDALTVPEQEVASMHPAAWDTDRLLQECECRAGRRRGPGGQHRNKVETAMVITHLPTSLSGEASERRSQLQNRKQALFRLRLNLALQIRQPLPVAPSGPSETWRKHCPRGKIAIRVNHQDYPSLLAEALDTVVAYRGMLAASAACLNCTPSQLTRFLKDLPRAFAVVNGIRETHGLKPLR